MPCVLDGVVVKTAAFALQAHPDVAFLLHYSFAV